MANTEKVTHIESILRSERGELIVKMRKHMRMKGIELAKLINVSQPVYVQLEAGTRDNKEQFYKIKELYRSWLIGEKEFIEKILKQL